MKIGKWQRKILLALRTSGEIWVRDVLPEGFTNSDYSAMARAARRLQVRAWLTLRRAERYRDGRRFLLATKKGCEQVQLPILTQGAV